jgi:hypothetical protein
MWRPRFPCPVCTLPALLAAAVLYAFGAQGAGAIGTVGCSSFGGSWERGYNLQASKDGNPIRILAACCKPGPEFGENACTITVTLEGTADRGCEEVTLNARGVPVAPGKHLTCRRTS